MAWEIEIDPAAQKELKKLGAQPTKRILKFLSERLALADNPRSLGAALKGTALGPVSANCQIGASAILTNFVKK